MITPAAMNFSLTAARPPRVVAGTRSAPRGARTVMEDRALYAQPLGPIGRLANRLFVAPALTKIFQHRGDSIRLRFGAAGRSL